MDQYPPKGSKIEIDFKDGYQTIVVPHANPGITRFLIGGFLLFWLGAWFVGLVSALTTITTDGGGILDLFLLFWIGGWILGGIFAIHLLYRTFRKSVPEQYQLNRPNLSIDTGIPPFNFNYTRTSQKAYWRSMFPKRKRLEFTPAEIKSLRLRETDTGNRLTIDKGTGRIDLAASATEIEREWLYKFIKHYYV